MPLSEIARLTDRQIWEVYILPRIRQQKRERLQAGRESTLPGDWQDVARTDTSQAEVVDDNGNPQTGEDALWSLHQMGFISRERVEATIQQKRDWLARQAKEGGEG